MFNMFKHEDSVIFDPIWCSVIGSDISKSTGAPKKRFLEEYERDLCYRRCAKKLIDEDLIYGVTNANYAKRPDAMKITAVIYQLMYGDKEADYAKLLSLFGKEYASTADVVSGLYRRMADPTAKLPFKYIKDTWGSDLGNVAVFAIYLLASPESYLPQNRKSFERLSEVFSQINSTRKNTSPMSDQQKVLMKYGISIQKNFSDFETAAMQGSRTRTIPVENEDGTCTQDTIFSYSDYGVHCHSELLSGLAMLDAGVSNCSNYDKTITKQKFLDAQKAVAKSLNFTKEMDGKVKFGDMFSLIDDGHIKVDEKGNIKADEDSGLATIELINLYNMMVPVYLSFRNLSEAYKEEIQSSLSDSLFGNAKNSDSEKLMKKIEELEKMLDKAKADVEVFRKDESNHIRISQDGVKYIRSVAKDSLDSEKRANMKRRFKGEQGRRLNRVETTSCMCRAAGIPLAKEVGISLSELLITDTQDYTRFMNDYFYDKGLLFLSDELSATIKATHTVGEEYTTGRSRLVGIIINCKGIFFIYCTLDKLMRWIVSYEHRRADAITKILKDSDASKQNADFNYVCSLMYKSVIIGKTCAMIPKIITGNKYGKAVTNPGKNGIADNLLTLTNLEQVYARNYFVPTNTLGVELLSRTVTLTRDDLNQMIEMWLSEMTNTHTCVDAREYTEAYIDDDSEKTLIFPIIELEELVYQKAGREKYHIVCERGIQDGISRTMGNKVIDFKDMNNEPMPAHKYDDAGIRRDGINPLTHSGYWEGEP